VQLNRQGTNAFGSNTCFRPVEKRRLAIVLPPLVGFKLALPLP